MNTQSKLYVGASVALALFLLLLGMLTLRAPVSASEIQASAAVTFDVSPTSGSAGSSVQFSGCGWGKGENVDVYFDNPAQKIAGTVVTLGGGCFETDGQIPSEAISGTHTLTATGDMGNAATTTFLVTDAELLLSPDQAPAGSPVDASGCGWAPNTDVTVHWSDSSTIGNGHTDAQGCLQTQINVPGSAASGHHAVTADSTAGTSTSSSFDVTVPDVTMTPDEGPAGSTITASGCGWLAGEQVSITWVTTGASLGTDYTDSDGCFARIVTIPSGAGDGDHTVSAAGDTSGASAQTTFTVMDPELAFFPDHGRRADEVTSYGCAWTGNSQITVKWSDGTALGTTNLRSDGCFDLDVTIPNSASIGMHTVTAEGTGGGVATATFTVSNAASLNIGPNSGTVGDVVNVYGLGWGEGEVVEVRWPDGTLLGSEAGHPDGTIQFDVDIPIDAAVGVYTVTATGDQGSSAQDLFTVENDAALLLFGDAPAGAHVDASLCDFADGEEVTVEWPNGRVLGSETYAYSDTLCPVDFGVNIPTNASPGVYTVTATGDKGGYAEEPFTVVDDTEAPHIQLFQFPDPLPTYRTTDIIAWASDNGQLSRIDLYINGTRAKVCNPPFDSAPTDPQTKTCSIYDLSLPAGQHTYRAVALDREGNRSEKTGQVIAFETGEPPTVTVHHTPREPADGQSFDIVAEAEDQQGGIQQLTIWVNGTIYPFSYSTPRTSVSEKVTYTPAPGERVVTYRASAFDAGSDSDITRRYKALIGNSIGGDSDNDGIGDAVEAVLCTSPTDPDSDHDALRDGWEVLGLSFSDGDFINLPQMGADPCHRDVFVQYDYEKGAYVSQAAIQGVINTFNDHGVSLHVDENERPRMRYTGNMTSTQKAETASYVGGSGNYWFPPKRNWTHHYLFSRMRKGRSFSWRYVTIDVYGGDWNCPVSISDPDSDPGCQQGRRSRADLRYRFIHELGHNLGLGHGGRTGNNAQTTNGDIVYYDGGWNNRNNKPNYFSVMNYRYSYSMACYNASNNDWLFDLDYQSNPMPTLDESNLDERPSSAFSQALQNRSCGGAAGYNPVVLYSCSDPDESQPNGSNTRYMMVSDGTQTVVRKSASTNGFTTTVPSHAAGIDWNCDGSIGSSVSENLNGKIPGEVCDGSDNDNDGKTDEGCGRSWDANDSLVARADWWVVPTGRACLPAYDKDKGQWVQPQTYRDLIDAPACPFETSSTSTLEPTSHEPPDQHTHPDENLPLHEVPNAEVCDGVDNDGDLLIDEACPDRDGDGVVDGIDNCPAVANPKQADADTDFRGDACTGLPGTPTGVTADVTTGGVVLSWTAPDGGQPVAGYNVYRLDPGAQNFRYLGAYPSTETTTFTDTTVSAGEYTYVVRAINRYGEEGDPSNEVAATVESTVYIPVVIR